jgi:hypothetical protein
MYPRIKSISVEDNYILIVTFENDIVKKYDFKPMLDRPEFNNLKDKLFFSSVKVDVGGYGISWNDELDLSEYELWINGK